MSESAIIQPLPKTSLNELSTAGMAVLALRRLADEIESGKVVVTMHGHGPVYCKVANRRLRYLRVDVQDVE